MKSFAASLILFAIMITALTINGIYINNVTDTLKQSTLSITHNDLSPEQIETIHRYWQKNIDIISISVNFHETESITESILSMKAYANIPDSPEFQYAKSKLLETLDKISLGEKISISNIL